MGAGWCGDHAGSGREQGIRGGGAAVEMCARPGEIAVDVTPRDAEKYTIAAVEVAIHSGAGYAGRFGDVLHRRICSTKPAEALLGRVQDPVMDW